MIVPFLDAKQVYLDLKDELDAAYQRVMNSGWYILGGEVEAFEGEFARACGTDLCVALGSGTDAIYLALLACNIGSGDEVIVPSHTFVATAISVLRTGAMPVFVDVDGETATLDPQAVEDAITPSTRAILPVHLYGQCAEMHALQSIAERFGLRLIEDAAQAHGATFRGHPAGSLGDVGCFSFYPTKNLGAFGDGGAIVTSDASLAERCVRLRNYGQRVKYHHDTFGINSRLDELQAAFLRVRLSALQRDNERRRHAADFYRTHLAGAVPMFGPVEGREHVYHLFVVRSVRRDQLQQFLAARGVQTQIHYPIPIHRQTFIHTFPHRARSLELTERFSNEVLSLPIHPAITEGELAYVATAVRDFIR